MEKRSDKDDICEKKKTEETLPGYRILITLVALISLALTSSSLVSHFYPSHDKQPASSTTNESITISQRAGRTRISTAAQINALAYANNLTSTERDYIRQIDVALADLRYRLENHPAYPRMKVEDNVKIFMNTHVYCVWDFMNLIKRLQIYFTSVQVPWRPTTDTDSRYLRRLANEIILEEETDELEETFISHFSYYVECLLQVHDGVISNNLTQFINDISNESVSYTDILNNEYYPSGVQKFLQSTKDFAVHDNIIVVAAAFTFGREVMLPEIFKSILKEGGVATLPKLSKFVNYLDRHITLDGDYHSHLAKKMVLKLVKTQEEWNLVIETATKALQARLALWDDVYKRIL